ncbi:MAG: hypothetical protein WCX65_14750 [bacterium]
MADWSKVTIEDMLNGLSKLAKAGEGKHVFDVTVFDDDGNETLKCVITYDNGVVSWAKGGTDDSDAVLFQIKRGGVETMKAMQIDGLDAAMRLMFDGSIYTTNPAGAQKWFEIFELGEEALEKALA